MHTESHEEQYFWCPQCNAIVKQRNNLKSAACRCVSPWRETKMLLLPKTDKRIKGQLSKHGEF